MKACPYCAESIQNAAIVCRFCGRELGPVQIPAVPPSPPAVAAKATMPAFTWTVLGPLALIVVASAGIAYMRYLAPPKLDVAGAGVAAARTRPAAATAPGPVLRLLSFHDAPSATGRYVHVRGEVENISTEPLRNVTVVATWRTAQDELIVADSALIDLNTLMPGQRSSFETMTQRNPQMAKFGVTFTAGGRQLATRYERADTNPAPPREIPVVKLPTAVNE